MKIAQHFSAGSRVKKVPPSPCNGRLTCCFNPGGHQSSVSRTVMTWPPLPSTVLGYCHSSVSRTRSHRISYPRTSTKHKAQSTKYKAQSTKLQVQKSKPQRPKTQAQRPKPKFFTSSGCAAGATIPWLLHATTFRDLHCVFHQPPSDWQGQITKPGPLPSSVRRDALPLPTRHR